MKADNNNQGLHKPPVKMAFAGLKKQINKANQVSDRRVHFMRYLNYYPFVEKCHYIEMTDPLADRDSEG